uniref:Tudor domain-containing protein n=1 Tax=Rhipicephalus microplus TaxID=6941 RepID=A0A6G5AHB0_RHIMP
MAIEAFRSAQQWKQRMNVIVLKVVSPTRFLIRESSGPAMSPSVREFISLEAEMIHYRTKCDLEPFTSLLPQLGSIVLVQNRSLKKWYRGRVNNVFDTISGYQVEVFLVDYGKTLLVDRRDLHKVPNKRILEVPFQCIEFLLLGVGPLRLTIDPATITAIYVRGSSWDTASIDHVNSRVQKADAVHIEVLGKTTSGGLCGKLFIDCNKNVIALDKELVKLNYAFLDAAAGMEEVILDDYKPEKDDQQPVKESQDEDTSKGSNFWDDIQRKSASAASKEVLDSVYGTSSSSLVLVPLEVCEAEESPPSSGSASGECSPLHWSSSSTSISIDTSSSGTDTPPTLPGLGRGLSLMLRVKEFASDSSCCEPSARGSIDMQTEKLSTAMLSPSEYSDEDACYTPTPVGTPPAVFRDRETAYSPEKLNHHHQSLQCHSLKLYNRGMNPPLLFLSQLCHNLWLIQTTLMNVETTMNVEPVVELGCLVCLPIHLVHLKKAEWRFAEVLHLARDFQCPVKHLAAHRLLKSVQLIRKPKPGHELTRLHSIPRTRACVIHKSDVRPQRHADS